MEGCFAGCCGMCFALRTRLREARGAFTRERDGIRRSHFPGQAGAARDGRRGVALAGPGTALLRSERGCSVAFGGRVGSVRGPGCRSEPQCLPAAGFRECRHPTHHRGLAPVGGGRPKRRTAPGPSAYDAECRRLLGRLRNLLGCTVGGVLQGAGGQMRISLSNARVAVAEDLLHLVQAATTVHEH